MDDKKFAEALGSVMSSLLERAEEERLKSDHYQDLFKLTKKDSCEGALRNAEHKMSSIALDVSTLLEKEYGIKVTNDKFHILMALPFIVNHLTDDIRKTEGYSCCVDKAYYILNKLLLDKP
jgi:hypothetical protein